MFRDKKSVIRHKVLRCLNDNFFRSPEESNIAKQTLTASKIAEIENIKVGDVIKYHEVLIDRKHVHCNSDGIGEHNITLLKDGKTAYFEEIYLIEGRKIFNDNIYDRSKW